ncbi:hypothetical protein FDJ06_gp107 [Pseudomonas phage SL2]|uniref:Uncharacterized protein n=1 Tax=Pseudomonas phage SL2 TaxID=2041345 RepID=A0A2D1GQR9_9CAUD|nr:hypothetical protein FDJ06_gp107 [Pseudomonas phage SL2]ATN94684.1 hypothetical protein SL2_107 [Pseudomonas phage SL2]BDR26437.1 hypothetical protein RVBP18_0920 [Pseudomonas phage sp. LC]
MSENRPLYIAAIKKDLLKTTGLYKPYSDSPIAVVSNETSKWHVMLNILRHGWEWIEIPEGEIKQPESYHDYVILALTTVLTDTLDYKNDPNSDKYIKQIICTDIALKVEYDKLINVLETSNELDLADEYTFTKQGNLRGYFHYDEYYGLDVLACASYVICSHIELTPRNVK